jgi:membrane-anchored glycerophosphoryl diester phosphodiesterase (GDPDase)
MTALEAALIILVVIWSVIFLIIGIALVMIFLAIKRAITKANDILDKTEAVADKVDLPSKVVMASIVAFMAKNSIGSIKNIISGIMSSKK